MSSGRRLTESSVLLTREYVKANIATTLASIRTDRADTLVSTEPPPTQSYFIYPDAQGYKAPALFFVAEGFDFKISESQSNYIAGICTLNVSAMVEDRDQEKITIKAWRYQSALHQLLNLTTLTSPDQKIRLEIVVKRTMESPPFKDKDAEGGAFRKLILLSCEVEHFENL